MGFKSMNHPLGITLVIPTYNRAKLIIETIESALNQSAPFTEIIVVDDASTDSTLIELKKFGRKITVVASEKIGVQAARNKGVALASTEYVTLCDSDDLLDSNFVAMIGEWLTQRSDCDSIYSNFVTFDENSTSTDKFSLAPSSFFKDAVESGSFLHKIPDLYIKTVGFQPLFSSGVTIRKQFYQSIGGYDSTLNGVGSEDWEYTLRAIENGKTALCVIPLVKIRRHLGNDSNNKIRQLLGEVTVLELALASHKSACQFKEEIASGINSRRCQAFELAFGLHQYDTANTVLCQIFSKPNSIKFHVKVILTRLIFRFQSYSRASKLQKSVSVSN